jgi:hypothetical protein
LAAEKQTKKEPMPSGLPPSAEKSDI